MLRILGVLLRKSNMSILDISSESFVSTSTLACGGYMRALKRRRLVYISGWKMVHGRFSTPLYSLGDFADVLRPRVDETSRDSPGMRRIVETLEQFGALTYRDIAKYSGLSTNTLKSSDFLDALVTQARIHICGWRRSNKGPMSPIYSCGPGVPVSKPPAMTGVEKCQRHRARARIAAQGVGLTTQFTMLAAALEHQAIG